MSEESSAAATARLAVRSASKTFGSGDLAVAALADVSFTVGSGAVAVVTGPSGSGKSTLLSAICGLERLDTGDVVIDGQSVFAHSAMESARFRRTRLGIVFQFFNLIPTLTAVENVSMPLVLDGRSAAEADEHSRMMLEQVGLGNQLDRYGSELSGGQLQRVAIARALVAGPAVVVADEPTGNLDRATGARIDELLRTVAADCGAALVIATHDLTLVRPGDLRVQLVDGSLSSLE